MPPIETERSHGVPSWSPGWSPGEREPALAEALREHRSQLGDAFPRIALFLFDCPDAQALHKILDRIPDPLPNWFEEVVVMQDRPASNEFDLPPELAAGRPYSLQVHRNPRDYGHGGGRKAAFEYALRMGFDRAVFMRGDGFDPPEVLPRLLHPALVEGQPLVTAPRPRSSLSARRAAARWLATTFQNAVLGFRLRDLHAGMRVYALSAVKCAPFQLNANDALFDAHLLMQFRALGLAAWEVPISAPSGGPDVEHERFAHLRTCWAAVDYRLHQLHVTQQGRYLVQRDVHYTLKSSETGSHMQIVGAIREGSRVLDLGCSQGLLARPLREKSVRVTGVDTRPPERLAIELDEYFQRDLEEALELPTGRVYDYVVVADVIEHVRNRAQLLRNARRYLKADGRLLISTPNIALWFYRLSLLAGRFEYGPRGVLDETHVHLFTQASFQREVEKAGFHVLEKRATALPFEVVFQSTGRSRLVRGIARLYHVVARIWPSMFAYQFVLEAEITTLDEESTAPL